MTDPRVEAVIEALIDKKTIDVSTFGRRFKGRVWEVGRSPFEDTFTARVVDDGGYVHYFRPDKDDATIRVIG